MGRNKELILNSLYFLIGNLGSKIIGLIMVPLYTVWMSPEEYGVVDLINSYNNIFLLIVGLGIADALVVFPINKEKEVVTAMLSSALLFHLLCCILFWGLFFFIDLCNFTFLDSINSVIWYAFAFLITSTTSRLFQSFCRGIKKMKVFSYTGIITAFSTAILSYLLVPDFGVKGYMNAIIISNIISIIFVILYPKCYQYFRASSFSITILLEMLKFSIPLIPNSIMWWLILGMNRPLLEQYVGITALGILAVSNKFPMLIDMFYSFFHQSWIVTAVSEIEKPDFSNYYNKVFSSIVSFQTLMCLSFMLLGKYIVDRFIDVRYSDAWNYIPFMCLTVIVSNISVFSTSIFTALKKTQYLFYTVIIAAVISTILNFTLIPLFGIWGALISIFSAHTITTITRISFGWRYIKLSNLPYIFTNLILCSMSIFAASISITNLRIVSISCLIIVYFIINRNDLIYIYNLCINRIKH